VIFLRSFLLSFDILWRYALVLPFLIVALAVFGIFALIAAFLLGLFSPFLGLVLSVAFGVAAGIIPVMIGLRVGLQGHHVRPRNSFFGLIMPAVGYGFFEALFVLILLAAGIAMFVLLTPLALTELLSIAGPQDYGMITTALAENQGLTAGAMVIGGGLAIAMRTALMVPLSGASIGADPDGRSHTPFYGFGDGFLSIFPLVVISQIGIAMSIPFVIWLSGPLGIADSMADTIFTLEEAAIEQAEIDMAAVQEGVTTTGEAQVASISPMDALLAVKWDVAILAAIAFFCFLYFFSLQCAGAVLVFLRRLNAASSDLKERDNALKAQIKEPEPEQMQETDMMELMRSRMPTKRY